MGIIRYVPSSWSILQSMLLFSHTIPHHHARKGGTAFMTYPLRMSTLPYLSAHVRIAPASPPPNPPAVSQPTHHPQRAHTSIQTTTAPHDAQAMIGQIPLTASCLLGLSNVQIHSELPRTTTPTVHLLNTRPSSSMQTRIMYDIFLKKLFKSYACTMSTHTDYPKRRAIRQMTQIPETARAALKVAHLTSGSHSSLA